MNVGIRFYSMGKVAKGKIVSELLEVHLEYTSQLSILSSEGFFPQNLKDNVSTDEYSAPSEIAALV